MTKVESLEIIQKYYYDNPILYKNLLIHSFNVAKKAISISKNLMRKKPEIKLDLSFIFEAALLHDIGIIYCNAPKINCYGEKNYLRHGIIGKYILIKEGLVKHSLICERHIGVGIDFIDILKHNLDLPLRNYKPISIEEKIICLADKFFSKSHNLDDEKSLEQVKVEIGIHGKRNLKKLNILLKELKYDI